MNEERMRSRLKSPKSPTVAADRLQNQHLAPSKPHEPLKVRSSSKNQRIKMHTADNYFPFPDPASVKTKEHDSFYITLEELRNLLKENTSNFMKTTDSSLDSIPLSSSEFSSYLKQHSKDNLLEIMKSFIIFYVTESKKNASSTLLICKQLRKVHTELQNFQRESSRQSESKLEGFENLNVNSIMSTFKARMTPSKPALPTSQKVIRLKRGEHKKSATDIADLIEKITSDHTKSSKKAQEKIEELESRLQNLSEMVPTLQERLQLTLQNYKSKTCSQCPQIKQELEAVSSNLNKYLKKEVQLETSLEYEKKKSIVLSQEIASLKSKLSQASQEGLAEFNRKLKLSSDEIQNLRIKCTKVETLLQEETRENEQRVKDLVAANSDLLLKVDILESKLATPPKNIDSVNFGIQTEEISTKIATTETDISLLPDNTDVITRLESRESSLIDQLDVLKKEVDSKDKQIYNLENSQGTLLSQISHLQQQILLESEKTDKQKHELVHLRTLNEDLNGFFSKVAHILQNAKGSYEHQSPATTKVQLIEDLKSFIKRSETYKSEILSARNRLYSLKGQNSIERRSNHEEYDDLENISIDRSTLEEEINGLVATLKCRWKSSMQDWIYRTEQLEALALNKNEMLELKIGNLQKSIQKLRETINIQKLNWSSQLARAKSSYQPVKETNYQLTVPETEDKSATDSYNNALQKGIEAQEILEKVRAILSNSNQKQFIQGVSGLESLLETCMASQEARTPAVVACKSIGLQISSDTSEEEIKRLNKLLKEEELNSEKAKLEVEKLQIELRVASDQINECMRRNAQLTDSLAALAKAQSTPQKENSISPEDDISIKISPRKDTGIVQVRVDSTQYKQGPVSPYHTSMSKLRSELSIASLPVYQSNQVTDYSTLKSLYLRDVTILKQMKLLYYVLFKEAQIERSRAERFYRESNKVKNELENVQIAQHQLIKENETLTAEIVQLKISIEKLNKPKNAKKMTQEFNSLLLEKELEVKDLSSKMKSMEVHLRSSILDNEKLKVKVKKQEDIKVQLICLARYAMEKIDVKLQTHIFEMLDQIEAHEEIEDTIKCIIECLEECRIDFVLTHRRTDRSPKSPEARKRSYVIPAATSVKKYTEKVEPTKIELNLYNALCSLVLEVERGNREEAELLVKEIFRIIIKADDHRAMKVIGRLVQMMTEE